MNDSSVDAVFVGGGHNGLVAATRLARAGLRVRVLEAGTRAGGAASAHEIHPGFQVPALAHVLPAFDGRAVRKLGLRRHDLQPGYAPVPRVLLLPDGDSLTLSTDPKRAAESIRHGSAADARMYPDFMRRMDDYAKALRPLLNGTPPRLDFDDRRNLLTLGRLGWSLRRRGRTTMRELLRIITMNVADLLEENFESDALKGAFALEAVLGTDHGPRSPNTVFTFLHRHAGHSVANANGASAVSGRVGHTVNALVDAAEQAGVEIRTGTRVARIRVEGGRARGVELGDGSFVEAGLVVSNADPATTLGELVGGDHLDADFLADVRALRTRGTTGKVNFALDRLPELPMPPGGGPARWLIAPSIDYVETAFNHVKYGEVVPEPALEITIPSLGDPDCAPGGQHVMSVNVAHAPYSAALDPDALGETVTGLIERHAPGFSDSILARDALGPREIEQRFGIRGGHWHHGDIALDQFFMVRPVPGWAHYRTPVDGLYLCSAGTHPGGGVTGTNGINAAREILRDRKHGRQAA